MASETLLPTGTPLTATNWASYGTGSIDETVASHDGDTGGYRIGAADTITPYPKWDMTNVAVVTGTITEITFKMAARTESGSHGFSVIGYINSIATLSASFSWTTSFSVQSQVFSGSWSTGDLDTLVIEFQSTFGDSFRVTAFEALISTGSGGSGTLYGGGGALAVTSGRVVIPRRSLVIWPYN